MSVSDVHTQEAPRRVPAVWGNVPQRNKNFTGREDLLDEVHRRITEHAFDVTAVLPHALHGTGGVGKTHLAAEYVHRYAHEYDLVWWIQADQGTVVTTALAALAPHLELSSQAPGRADEASRAVLDALRRGEPYQRWLLVFDNADQPEAIRHQLPHGPGHVLVTSRNHRWESVADTVEVDVFARQESLEFLRRRVPEISERDADRLAEALGDLPLALEQAGALQAETGMSVAVYLDLLDRETSRVLGEGQAADYPVPVAAAWSVSMGRLREQMPDAMELLRRCAYFGPEPISLDLLNRGRFVLGPPMRDTFRDPLQLSRAFRELGRYSLARIDNRQKTLQVHRLIQAVIRNEVPPEDAETVRHEVHLLLAAADPGDPDDADNWPAYAELLPHIRPAHVLECREPVVRQLARNVVRYLYTTGNYTAARSRADEALKVWREAAGEEWQRDPDILIMSRHKAGALRMLGQFAESYELSEATLEAMKDQLGENHEERLILINDHAALLRVRGDFLAARDMDEASLRLHREVFGDHRRTFMSATNLAVDHALTTNYQAARELHEQTYRDRRDFYGRDDHLEVLRSRSALADLLRQLGDYIRAGVEQERIREDYLTLVHHGVRDEDHPHVLQQATELGVARRLVGATDQAVELLRSTYELYRRRFGEAHAETLPAVVALGNALIHLGELEEAAALVDQSVAAHAKVLGPDHPLTFGCMINQAMVRRLLGDSPSARTILLEALAGLDRRLWPEHHFALIGRINLASTLAALGDVEQARQLGMDALPHCTRLLGKDHPHTLVCTSNLVLDLRALDRNADADELAATALDRYRDKLGADHPRVRDMEAGQRLEMHFEPPPL